MKNPFSQAKHILLYSDSEPNELLIGMLHFLILPFAMLELGNPLLLFQIGASAAGLFQLYAVLCNGTLTLRKYAVMLAIVIALMTVVNYFMAGMLSGSHIGWLLILGFAIWNLIRIEREHLTRGRSRS